MLDIIFQSGHFYSDQNSSMLESLLGAFIGAASALSIYYLQTRKERINETNSRIENQKNALQYFIALSKSITDAAKKQLKSYEDHVIAITENPLDQHLLAMIVEGDLDRILNKLNHERLFHAYLNHFTNSNERINKFQKLFSKLDYLYNLYPHVRKLQENYVTDLTERLFKYRDLAEEKTINYSVHLANFLKHTDKNYEQNPFYNLINSSIGEYHDNQPDPITLSYVQTNFIDPFKEKLIANFRNIPEAVELIDSSRKATWLFNETIEKSKQSAKDFDEYSKQLKKTISDLEELIKDLCPTAINNINP